MEITLSMLRLWTWTHVWPAHDGLKLMRYRFACRLHLTLKVYNFCNMSNGKREKEAQRVNEPMKKNGGNCIQNESIFFASFSTFFSHPHHQHHIRMCDMVCCTQCRFLVILLALARKYRSSFPCCYRTTCGHK